MKGLYAAGDSLYASNCFGHAASTGYYAGRHAAKFAQANDLIEIDRNQVEKEKERVYAPLKNDPKSSIGWKELNMGISKTMQNYCGEVKHDELLNIALQHLKEYEEKAVPNTFAYNPHELMRLLEVFDILTVSQIIVQACLARKTSSRPLCFIRGGEQAEYKSESGRLITVKQLEGQVTIGELPLDYFGDLKDNYQKYNEDYVGGENHV